MSHSAARRSEQKRHTPDAGSRPPTSGTQFRLAAAGYAAEIASVGATLRSLRHDGRDLIASFPEHALRPAMRGALLVPWAGRTSRGAYTFDGLAHTLAINDPSTGSALHGLMSWIDFEPVERSPELVALRAILQPQSGYPWRLRVDVRFRVDADGLAQEVTVTNLSSTRAPVGIGVHPYLVAGPSGHRAADEWLLELAADVVMLTDRSLIPIAREPVDASGAFDFRAARPLAGVRLNHSFTELIRSPTGLARVALTDEAGDGVEMTWDERCDWVHVYTADEPVEGRSRAAVAVEPMTCPPDALNSKQDLHLLDPGRNVDAGWRLRGIRRDR